MGMGGTLFVLQLRWCLGSVVRGRTVEVAMLGSVARECLVGTGDFCVGCGYNDVWGV
jgi:hypothetical protein